MAVEFQFEPSITALICSTVQFSPTQTLAGGGGVLVFVLCILGLFREPLVRGTGLYFLLFYGFCAFVIGAASASAYVLLVRRVSRHSGSDSGAMAHPDHLALLARGDPRP